jgi:hypothetical protein
MSHSRSRLLVACLPVALLLVAVAGAGRALAAPVFTRVSSIGVGSSPSFGMQRTADGVLHLVYQTAAPGSSSPSGLGARAISTSGGLGPEVQALSGWNAGKPGLVALPSGALEAVFGAISPPPAVSSVWGVASSDGGGSWAAPTDVKGGGPLESLAYGADVTAQVAGGTPIVTLPQGGGLVIQRGLGPGSPSELITDNSDNAAGDVNSAVDGAGTMVVAWQSLAGNGGDFMRAVAPADGPAMQVPGQLRNQLVVAGRDTGAGVFAPFTPDGTRVSLQRYGGGSVAVGKAAGVTAKVLGVATGLAGRIWVMWGDENGVALTRSNKADTRFEPIQRVKPNSASLYRLSGDGRLGPLDMLVDQIPNGNPIPPGGTFYARVLPVLSVTASVKKGKGKAVALTVKVTDAGDVISGATVAAAGKKSKTNASGVAKLALAGKGAVTITVTEGGYQAAKKRVTL